ncbi:MAG: porin, partial [Zoogloeaceae bacterium]|nr:porin [Zoogloeaceae bacterium]
MQKKLLALAVAGAVVSSPALAQSNVTIYGSIDMGFAHRSNHVLSGVSSKNS